VAHTCQQGVGFCLTLRGTYPKLCPGRKVLWCVKQQTLPTLVCTVQSSPPCDVFDMLLAYTRGRATHPQFVVARCEEHMRELAGQALEGDPGRAARRRSHTQTRWRVQMWLCVVNCTRQTYRAVNRQLPPDDRLLGGPSPAMQ
jgi:hypothetical protein